ncbi:MAG: TonB family protein [Candidatus Eremiobacteraeota bacterium]|nr:TonB family protein [Candidatus Eremiobacteraeota bacterium]
MRSFGPLVLAVLLVLSATTQYPAHAAEDTLHALQGHWHCTGTGVRPTERSFFEVHSDELGHPNRREVFSAADSADASGVPYTAFERIQESEDHSAHIESSEGNGSTTSTDMSPLRFTGRTFDDRAPLTISYDVNDATLHRTVTEGTAITDDETCTRDHAMPVDPNCPRPNVPAHVIHAVEPNYPADAIATRAQGVVVVRVVLDDQSRVLWADVLSSASPVFNDVAVQAARDSTYRTAVRDCRPIAALYAFSVDFTWR